MKNIVLFSQSSADIQYVLSLYKANKSNNIKIIVINVYNNYKFFKNLNLKAELFFIPTVSLKNIYKYTLLLFKIKRFYKEHFFALKDTDIYFFSKNYDYTTAYFVEKLSKCNKVKFIDINKSKYDVKNNILNSIKIFILKSSLGIKVYFDSYSYIYKLNNKIELLEMDILNSELNEFKYNVNTKKNTKKNLLFFESDSSSYDWFQNYSKDLKYIMDILVKNYNIFVKPHPRLGYTKLLNEYNVTFIDDFIPSELLYLEKFNIVIGVETSSLATINFEKTYSLINLFEYNDLSRKQYIMSYLKNLSSNNIIFLDNLSSFDKPNISSRA